MPWSRRGLLAGAAASIVPGAPARAAPVALRRGINAWPWFSLTREYPAPRTDYAWPPLQPQRPVPRARDLRSLKAAGFDFIRIPVDPGPFLSFAGERRRGLLNDLILAVEQCLAAGLSVLINVQANDATHFWNSARLVDTVAAAGFADYRFRAAVGAHRASRSKASIYHKSQLGLTSAAVRSLVSTTVLCLSMG